jgi:hypothetical protein
LQITIDALIVAGLGTIYGPQVLLGYSQTLFFPSTIFILFFLAMFAFLSFSLVLLPFVFAATIDIQVGDGGKLLIPPRQS